MIALHRQSIRSTIRAITLVAALTSLLLTMITPFVGTARADHDDPYNASNGSLDSVSFTMIGDDCGGNSDSIAKGGTKLDTIHLDDPPVLTDSSVTPKDNLCEFWADSAVDIHGDVWLYVAFTREATSGTAHVAIELLNDAADCDVTDYANCNPWEDRASGTRIVGFTWQGNDGLVSPTLWTFNGSGFNAGQSLESAFTGSTGSGGAFGEAAINLTAAGILPNVNDPAAACELLAAMIPLTLPGLSLGSQPKDVVLGNAPPISTCGTLVIQKVVDGGNDFGDSFVGTATGASTLTTDPLGHGDSDSFPNLKAGSFTVAEKIGATTLALGDTVDGWTLTNIDCGDGSATEPDTTAEVVAGETTTCTLYNTPDLPTITLEKTVVNDDGGTAEESDFQGSISGVGNVAWDAATEVDPGSYTASETTLPGYAASDWGEDCAADGSVTVGLGDDVTCTITNDDIAPTVVLRKTVVNDDGGTLDQGDFPSFLDGNPLAWDQTVDILAGNHTASETQQDGYTSTGWGGDCASDGSFTAVVGGTYECTITNDDAPAGLTIIKQVTNDDGGTLQATDFPLHYTPDGGEQVTVVNEATTTVPAGTYTIGETQQPGYELTGISCDDGTSTGEGEETVEVTVPNGETVVCTISNDDIAPTIVLRKTVVNDDGGTLDQGDFPSFLDGNPLAWDTPTDSTAGSHTVSETQQPGYTAGDWGGDCAADGSITMALAGEYECTITNDDQPATVVLRKTVVNDDGGTLTQDDFPAFVDGGSVAWDDQVAIDAGPHDASETSQPGYAAGDWGGDCAADGSFTAVLGGTYECTITNDDIAPTITLVKTVVNDDGGTLTADDFQGYVDGGEVDWEVAVDVLAGDHTASEDEVAGYAAGDWGGDCAADGSLTAVLDIDYTCTITNDDIAPTVVLRKTVVNDDGGTLTQDDFPVTFDGDEAAWDETITTTAGDHLAAELTQSGYVAGDWGGDCAADGSLTAELAGTYECTITNDDVPAGLTVVKQVVNDDGGTAVVADFPLTVTPEGGEATGVQSGAQTIVGAGTYTISEEQQPGYALESISCDNGTATTEGSLDVTVGLDEVVTCTIVNDDVPISISLIKVPDVTEIDFTAGGDEEVVTYTYTVTNTGELPLTDLSLVDDILGDITLPVDELAVGQTVFGTAEHVVTQEDADAGTIVNVAVVEGTSPDGRTTDDEDTAEVAVNLIEVAPQVIEKAPVLPATGFETMRLALWAALVAGLGALFLLATDEVQYARRRRD